MRRVWQTIDGPLGNCFAACVATIFDLELTDLPNFIEDWRDGDALREWAATRGLEVIFAEGPAPRGLSIMSDDHMGRPHAVVCLNGDIIHDPAKPRAPIWTTFRKG